MRALLFTAATLALASCAAPQGPGGPGGLRNVRAPANPSEVVVAELAFNRLAREKGQWTAFRETSSDEAVMFVPEQVNAHDWLKGRADPPAPVQWQPHQVYMSCDGELAASTGAWQRPDGTTGYFTTIWQKVKGGAKPEWEWILDHGEPLPSPREQASDMIGGRIADCQPIGLTDQDRLVGTGVGGGFSADKTLLWTWEVKPDGSRHVKVRLSNQGKPETVIDDVVGAPAAAGGD